jgi:hypothetical protein
MAGQHGVSPSGLRSLASLYPTTTTVPPVVTVAVTGTGSANSVTVLTSR